MFGQDKLPLCKSVTDVVLGKAGVLQEGRLVSQLLSSVGGFIMSQHPKILARRSLEVKQVILLIFSFIRCVSPTISCQLSKRLETNAVLMHLCNPC